MTIGIFCFYLTFQKINMNIKNILFYIIAVVALVGGLIWYARPDKGSPDPTAAVLSTLEAEETSYDFGYVSMAQGKVEKKFRIKNTDSSPATIEKVYTSCMCTEASLITPQGKFGPFGMPGHGLAPKVNKEIKPNDMVEVSVVFDPAAHGPAGVGPIERVVYIEEKNRLPLELKIKAVVTP